jgi:23S rRNA (uracil1939-C5)-methyltransferase
LTYQTQNASYRVSAGSFFQTNRFLTNVLVEIVTSGRSGDLALDLYAGVGLFSTALACDFRHIVSVEMSQTAFGDLKYNLPSQGKAVHSGTEQYMGVTRAKTAPVGKGALPQPLSQKPDLVVVDPPRSGLGDSVAGALGRSGAPRLTYVSCDPATLARDLVPLRAAGYRVQEVHLVDLFPQTYHLESIVQLVR